MESWVHLYSSSKHRWGTGSERVTGTSCSFQKLHHFIVPGRNVSLEEEEEEERKTKQKKGPFGNTSDKQTRKEHKRLTACFDLASTNHISTVSLVHLRASTCTHTHVRSSLFHISIFIHICTLADLGAALRLLASG